jgi:putative phosphoribosyl transferase
MFADRADAGYQLAQRLLPLAGPGTVVVGVPRGGVQVAAAVATVLQTRLDVILARKIGVPFRPEVAVGAVAEGGVQVIDHQLAVQVGMTPERLAGAVEAEWARLEAHARQWRHDRPTVPLAGCLVIVVDDGLATGLTAAAACRAARARGAARVVLAVPVAAGDAVRRLRAEADDLIAAQTPARFVAVSRWYHDFTQTTDEQVRDLLAASPSES